MGAAWGIWMQSVIPLDFPQLLGFHLFVENFALGYTSDISLTELQKEHVSLTTLQIITIIISKISNSK